MKINSIYIWFKNLLFYSKVKKSEIDNREFEWCIVGNIVNCHHYGMNKELKKGSKHFRPGAKVYCMPEFGGVAHETIRVLGKPRKQHRLINIIMPTKNIKNFRVQKIYHPKIQFQIGGHLYYWNNRRSKNELDNLEKMVIYLNSLSQEIDKQI